MNSKVKILVATTIAAAIAAGFGCSRTPELKYKDPYKTNAVFIEQNIGIEGYVGYSDLIVTGRIDGEDSLDINRISKKKSGEKGVCSRKYRFRISEIVHKCQQGNTDLKAGDVITWVVDCSIDMKTKQIHNMIEVVERDNYLLILKKVNNGFYPLRGALGRISDSTQQAAAHEVFGRKNVEEIKKDLVALSREVTVIQPQVSYGIKRLEVARYRGNIGKLLARNAADAELFTDENGIADEKSGNVLLMGQGRKGTIKPGSIVKVRDKYYFNFFLEGENTNTYSANDKYMDTYVFRYANLAPGIEAKINLGLK